jgi:plastocyanin
MTLLRTAAAMTAVLFVAAVPPWHPADAETIRIEVKGLVFSPATVTAHVGDVLEWVNDDFVAHTATARKGEWDVKLPPHATGRSEAKSPGKIEYYCRYHPNMKGEITIAPQ